MLLTKEQLENNSCVINPNMPLFGGFYYCSICKRYTYHYAMSHRGVYDCYPVCRECNNYTGNQELK